MTACVRARVRACVLLYFVFANRKLIREISDCISNEKTMENPKSAIEITDVAKNTTQSVVISVNFAIATMAPTMLAMTPTIKSPMYATDTEPDSFHMLAATPDKDMPRFPDWNQYSVVIVEKTTTYVKYKIDNPEEKSEKTKSQPLFLDSADDMICGSGGRFCCATQTCLRRDACVRVKMGKR